MVFFSKIEDTFQIPGRGCVIVPATPRSSLDFQFRLQDLIQLRNPDGRLIDTHIAGIEMLCGAKVRDRMALLLPGNIAPQDVPRGTEIWLTSER